MYRVSADDKSNLWTSLKKLLKPERSPAPAVSTADGSLAGDVAKNRTGTIPA